MFKVEKDWMYNGLRCVVIARDTGYRCGYVGIKESNLLYGMQFGGVLDMSEENKKDFLQQPAGKQSLISLLTLDKDNIHLDCIFDVHGGLTYSSTYFMSSYPVVSDWWWFGYDCAHYNDGIDMSIISDKYNDINQKYNLFVSGVVRDLDYCVDECQSLADQLIKFNLEV